MIDPSKTYRTRDGREVRIYAVDGGKPHVIHGAVKEPDGQWHCHLWAENGRTSTYDGHTCVSDLIEVTPRIKREVWVNVYDHWPCMETIYASRDRADNHAGSGRLACVKLLIDCEEGEGL